MIVKFTRCTGIDIAESARALPGFDRALRRPIS